MRKYENERRESILRRSSYGWSTSTLNPDKREEISKLVQLDSESMSCNTCNIPCPHRNTDARYPTFAKGKGQCVRWHRNADKNPYSWINDDGTVIAIPSNIIDNLFDEMAEYFIEKESN